MLPNKPPFFYKCNSCGKLFISEYMQNILSKLLKKVKCSHCGSRDVKFSSMNDFIKK